MKGLVLLLGGFVFKDLVRGRYERVSSVAERVLELRKRGLRLAVVTGGSDLARLYIGAVEALGGTNFLKDLAGILATRLHALVMISALGEEAYPEIVEDYDTAAVALAMGKIPVAGGMQPGQSTDAVAALMAERLGFDTVVKLTSVEGVYERDPEIHPDARIIEELTYEKLADILKGVQYSPGEYDLLDALSIKILSRSSISTIILSGDKPESLIDIVEGRRVGTLVKPR